MTTVPAPMVHHFPILIFGITNAPIPMWVPSPMLTLPANVAFGDIYNISSGTGQIGSAAGNC